MKKVVKVVLILVVALAAILCGVYAYYGGFSTIVFEMKEDGGEIFVYEDVLGDYSQSPEVMDRVYYTLLNNDSIATTRAAGIYYDNPNKVETDKRRSEIGCLLDETTIDSLQLAELSQKYKVEIIPRKDYVTTQFPNKGMLSVLVGIIKVYPAMDEYMKEKNLKDEAPVIEIYDVPTKMIIYRKEAIK